MGYATLRPTVGAAAQKAPTMTQEQRHPLTDASGVVASAAASVASTTTINARI